MSGFISGLVTNLVPDIGNFFGNNGGFSSLVLPGGGGNGGMATLSDIQNLPDPALQWMWTLDILGVPGLGTNISNLYAHDVNVPLLGFDMEPRFRAGIYEHFPRHAASYSMNVTFYEDGNFTVTSILEKWHQLIRDDTAGTFGLPIDYMGQAVCRLYDTAGNNNLTVTCYAVWPMRRGTLDLHYQGSSNLTVTCEFSVNISKVVVVGGLDNNPFYGNTNFANIPSSGNFDVSGQSINNSSGINAFADTGTLTG